MESVTPVGRLAPSPTGVLHLGNVRSFLWAWLSARAQNGRVLLRVEDLETAAKPGVVERMIDDLRWLGFDWDGEIEVQSRRRDYYRKIHSTLGGKIYPCRCTRADVAAAQAAPHEGDVEPRYPGTCRDGIDAPPVSWRLRVQPGLVRFDDLLFGPQALDVDATIGDPVVFKTPEQPAYQLAVVVDDLAQGVTEVVRGDDLIPSTARQILIYRALGVEPPAYGHVPLVVGPDGKRLAKRHGDARISSFRDGGASPERIIGVLAGWSGLGEGDTTPACLLARWSWSRVNRERIVLTPERLAELQ